MMYRFSSLLILWMVTVDVSSGEQNGFVSELDFGPIFNSESSGIATLASSPVAAAMLKVDKSQYPHLFDTVVSSSIDSLQRQVAPKDRTFDASSFGFNPIASQSFLPYGRSARIISQPAQYQHSNVQLAPTGQQYSPLRYDIRTVHDPNYKVYKPEENEEGKEILAALKNNPTVAGYFQPGVNVEVNHPLNYRKEELVENLEEEQNYNAKPYISGGSPRIRRYTNDRSENVRTEDEEEEDPYNYKADYVSRPEAFDESLYSSSYKKKKESKDGYEYPYNYDSGYDHKEYDRIKDLSEKQAAEIRQNPGNCKEVQRDGMTCMSCKDPKTGGNYESCSYVTEPKNNKYAYSKEKKFNSNDEPDEPENEQRPEGNKRAEKYQNANDDVAAPQKFVSSEDEKPSGAYSNANHDDDSDDKYKAYYVHTSKPKSSQSIREAADDDSPEDSRPKSYDYKKTLPEFYTDNEPKKDVEHVLAEFKKKDRSACKKVQKNGMTCFQCIDKSGLKNEECMFVSESAPKQSHLAYQEVKEFASKPATLEGNEEAESRTVTTSAPPAQKSAAYVVANSNYGKRIKRKKTATPADTNPVDKNQRTTKVKRSEGSQAEAKAQIVDETNIAPPEEFAGASSQGAYWAETMPRYSGDLGVTLPEFMLSRSEHEESFDEAVAGA